MRAADRTFLIAVRYIAVLAWASVLHEPEPTSKSSRGGVAGRQEQPEVAEQHGAESWSAQAFTSGGSPAEQRSGLGYIDLNRHSHANGRHSSERYSANTFD